MEVKAAVVHIGAAHNGGFVVGHEHLGVHKAGGVFKDTHAGFQKGGVEALGHPVHQLFVRDARGEDANIHSAFGGNTQRLYLVGDSAGGNMALDIAYKIGAGVYKDYPQVSRVSVIYPVTDIRAFYENNNIVTAATGKKMAVSYLGATPEKEPKRYAEFNPQNYIGSNTPPTLIVACGMDGSVPLDATINFAQALVDNQTQTKLVTVPFANHAVDWQANNFLGQAYINNTLEWFDK